MPEEHLAPSAFVSTPKPSKFVISLGEIRFDGTVFKLNAALQVALYVEDGIWNCEHEGLSSLSFGATPEQAVYAFCEDFSVLWDEIAKAPNECLTSGAQRVKQVLLSTVKAVENGAG